MRAEPQLRLAAGANYRRFAVVIVGIALLVALGATDQGTDAEAVPALAAAQAQISPPPAATPVSPALALGEAEQAEPAALDLRPDATPAATAELDQGEGTPVGAPPTPPMPTAPQLGQLAASSQVRSGGVEQGDAPQLGPPPG